MALESIPTFLSFISNPRRCYYNYSWYSSQLSNFHLYSALPQKETAFQFNSSFSPKHVQEIYGSRQ